MKILTTALCVILLSGCAEFAGGFATGMVAMEELANNAQEDLVETVKKVNARTAELNETLVNAENLIKPETVEAIKTARNMAKEPMSWVALASIIANGVWAGRTLEKRKKK
ncbi:hypothetical protein LCGC14_2221070 [marine sediment metagenome]|uniref:Uncharacterized protein n=1 Tax=marine sediment metagenome TaxID=412755 RepID=A0A0F9DAY3_9ZZZZ